VQTVSRFGYNAGFLSLDDARAKIEAWRRDYNEQGPQGSLGHLTPNEFATHRQEKRIAVGGANF
jgi:transposase InsO family protein